ncbi:uncharacterized protein LOC123553858 [Mercenaria mercenaria]|uniref:uncharacterized protein LOC123553858 n=1 Tax=Mercenaria mercenaria TaxID=6596 RepID=UPI00234F302B|nr:uncharacterized protein LOC123553858 [Mercenaria mercenaria]
MVSSQHSVVYNGGCRSKSICALATSIGKKREALTCSSCCNTDDECNKRLCGIKGSEVHSNQCYMCREGSSGQAAVRDPAQCVTLGYCQPNEMCSVAQNDDYGHDTFSYGCTNAIPCKFIMKKAYELYKVCVANVSLPEAGQTWVQACGNIGKRSTELCHACCADRNCNHGTCEGLRERIFKLALQGKFDLQTLKAIPQNA